MVKKHLSMILVLLLSIVESKPAEDDSFQGDLWIHHKKKYNLKFEGKENVKREIIFQKNLEFINEHNRNKRINGYGYTLKMNHLGHYKVDELSAGVNQEGLILMHRKINNRLGLSFDSQKNSTFRFAKKKVDWRKKGAVTKVENQGTCGSCWAFSAVGAIESAVKIKYGRLQSLSKQQLVDCDRDLGDTGCRGGLPCLAFEYAREIGLLSEEKYSYKGRESQCEFNFSTNNITKVKAYTVLENNESVLTEAIETIGPISIAIDALHSSFQFYHSGVYFSPNCKSDMQSLDHAVLVVGYGVDEETDEQYYIVKNSWSEKWGEHGYVRMARNKNNHCGIASFASYPTV